MRYHLSAPSSLAATFEPKALDDEALEFPNCDEVPMTWEQLQTYDGRIEYWDAALSTAGVLRDGAGIRHEAPCSVLGELLSRMALERGARIRCFGHAFLMVRDKEGRPRKIMCADQTVYLDPKPFQHTTDSDAVVIGSDRLPDVVLEVDHTTDVRRGKLKLYASWGFPRGMGGDAGCAIAEPAAGGAPWIDDLRSRRGWLPGVAGELGVSGLAGGFDSHGAERGGVVGGDAEGISAAGPCAGPGGRHRSRRRSAAWRPSALGAPPGADGGAGGGS